MPRIAIAPSQCSVISWNCRHARPAGCSMLYDLTSGMLPRPLMIRISRNSSCSLTELAVGLTAVSELRCWALADGASATHARRKPKSSTERRRAETPAAKRMRQRNFVMVVRSCLRLDRLAVRGHPAPRPRPVAARGDALLVDVGHLVAVAGQQRFGRAHLGAQRQFSFGQTIGAVFFVLLLRAIELRTAGAIGAFVHLAAGTEIAHLRILRRAERAGVEAVAAADAEVLGVQHDAIVGGVDGFGRTHRLAWGVGAVHARHRDRPLARLAVVNGDDAPAVDAPRHLVLVLAGGDAGVALDAPVGVAEKLHPRHGRASLRRPDLAERGLGFLHTRRRVEAVGGEGVHALAEHDRVGSLRIFAALVDALEPAGKMVWHPGHASANALGDQRLHPRLGVALGAGDPDAATVIDPAFGRIRRIDLDEHLLL